MKQQPKKIKHKKHHKGKLFKLEHKSDVLRFGVIGLKAMESGTLNYRQLEATRQAISRKTKRLGKIWIRVFTDRPITKKAIGSRMGKGKGSLDHWGVKVSGGTVLFELCGSNLKSLRAGLASGISKLPIKVKIFE